jgi:hypothetical protein
MASVALSQHDKHDCLPSQRNTIMTPTKHKAQALQSPQPQKVQALCKKHASELCWAQKHTIMLLQQNKPYRH